MIKKLLAILLLSLIPCFSFASFQEFDLGLNEEINANSNIGNSLKLLPNANFIVNDQYKIITIHGAGNYWSNWTYFRNGSGMYVMGGYHGAIDFQGYFNYYGVYDLSSLNGDSDPTSQFNPISGFLNNTIYANPDKLFLGGYQYLQRSSLCFGYTELNQAICFSFDRSDYNNCGGQPQFCPGGVFDYITNSQGYSSYDFDYLSSFATDSPFVGSSDKPSYEIGDNYYTNGQIVEGYEYLGLDIGYCYGGFPIDDIFEPNQTIDDFTGYEFGVGATVWDLYDLYSGAYSTPKQFFQQMLQAYMNGQINRFKTEPKALIMFVQQFVSGRDRGRINVGFYDIWDYCNLKFDNVDLNAQYTGNNKTPINGYNQKKVSDSNLGGFQFTGDNAFNIIVGTGGTGNISASEFFGNLTSRFQNGLGTVNTNYIGMIPTYILMFMFALIFIRLISH